MTTFANQSKHSSTFANGTKHASSFSNQSSTEVGFDDPNVDFDSITIGFNGEIFTSPTKS